MTDLPHLYSLSPLLTAIWGYLTPISYADRLGSSIFLILEHGFSCYMQHHSTGYVELSEGRPTLLMSHGRPSVVSPSP